MSNDQVKARLAFMEMGEAQRTTLAATQPIVRRLIGPALDRFYGRVRKEPRRPGSSATAAIWAPPSPRRQGMGPRSVSGRFNEDFHVSVRRIGKVHARIGLGPRWYIGGYAIVLEELLRSIGRRCSPWRRALDLFRTPSVTEASVAIVKAAPIVAKPYVSPVRPLPAGALANGKANGHANGAAHDDWKDF